MLTIRVFPDAKIQEAIVSAATAFEARLSEKRKKYYEILAMDHVRWMMTERRLEEIRA